MTIVPATPGEPGAKPDGLTIENPTPTSDSVDSHSSPEGAYFARIGTFFLRVPRRVDPNDAITTIGARLDSDSRVSEVLLKPLREAWTFHQTRYPVSRNYTTEALISGNDGYLALQISDPLIFRVHVPKKNQPLILGEDDVPVEDYWASWDGTTLIVLWERNLNTSRAPRSGGHVVIEVLMAACQSAGFDLEIQPCSPPCTNMFAHAVMRVTQFPATGRPQLSFKKGRHPVVEAHLHAEAGASAVLGALWSQLERPGMLFAAYKNPGLRILAMESRARWLVGQLLELDYRKMESANSTLRRRSVDWLKYPWRRLKREDYRSLSEELMSMLWLAMAGIETMKRDWLEARRRFDEEIEERGCASLYVVDRKDDDAAVETLDLSFVRGAVENRSDRMDNRGLALATLFGALLGATLTLAVTLLA